MPGPGVRMPSAGEALQRLETLLRERLTATRQHTLDLLASLDDAHLYEQPEPVMGVLAWDLGHVAFFEHRWLIEELGGEPVDDETADAFDPFEHPRSARGAMDLPDRKTIRSRLSTVRRRALEVLDDVDLTADDRLVRDGFVHDLMVRHEDQHRENMLVTLQLFGGDPTPPEASVERVDGAFAPDDRQPKPQGTEVTSGTVEVPAGTYTLGQAHRVGTYDNEAPAREVELDAFEIEVAPVTNGEYLRFVEDGGYEAPAHWSAEGWAIREALDRSAPKYWVEDDGTWFTREADVAMPLPLDQPVTHVSYHEAQAYASWAGKRLPTEAEWEVAAGTDPATGERTRFPWGDDAWTPERANLAQRTYGPAPVGAYPEGASPVGCHQMVGDVWEWTSTTFDTYEGFEPFPYEEYSLPHAASGFKVLRGGSWATMPSCAHVTFRNWHQPDHQHLFTGFRCARTVDP